MIDKGFVKKWIERLEEKELKNFPSDFIDSVQCNTVDMPGKILVLGPELFGAYELLDPEGNTQYQAPDLIHAKFVLYANRTKPEKISVPVDIAVIEDAVKEYEKHLDGLVKEMLSEYKSTFPNSSTSNEATNQIFGALKLQRY